MAAAKRLGISGGVGNNMFVPDKEITRQEMFTMLYNALKVIGELPRGNAGKPLSSFSDAGEIASWAKEAMTLMVENRTIGGNGTGTLQSAIKIDFAISSSDLIIKALAMIIAKAFIIKLLTNK